jgi:asparagine synthase (glutamine-hydrolysing)
MCGIAGIWNYKTGQPVERARLETITQALAHRGPDGCGYYTDGDLGLGHRRLSIIDIGGGHQPMCNEDSTVWITFNGEIYNYPELREQLLKRGHILRTHCDTEAIVHLYEDYGQDCFRLLRGMFALGIWDQKLQRLVLARDRIGIKPLFYGQGRDGIVFGSELKCVRDSGMVSLDVDATAIADLFTFYFIASPKTIYKNAESLEPAHYVSFSREGIRKQSYWDLPREELKLSSEKEYEKRLEEVLQDAVRSHLLSDVPVGAFLSGGIDSSIVVALMSGMVSEPVMTYSIGFEEREFDELSRARTIANLFSTNHFERVITPEPAKVLERLAYYYDEPFPDDSSMPTYAVSQLASERVKVVLSGDGGDENFAGYGHYARQLLLERCRRAPLRMRQLLLAPCREWGSETRTGSLRSRIHSNLHQLTLTTREGYITARSFADASMRSKLFSTDLQNELSGYDPRNVLREIYDRGPAFHPLSQMFYMDLKTWLVDDILTKVDRASMANSLEVRVPLLDHKVVEFAFSLPLGLKLRYGRGKYLLRKVMRKQLPPRHLDLPKKGFRVPLHQWMRGRLRGWAEDFIFADSAATPFLSREGIAEIWKSFQRGELQWEFVTSILLSFTMSAPVWGQGGEMAVPTRDSVEIGS